MHPFSQAEIARGAAVVATEHRSKRLLLKMTMGHRSLSLRQVFLTSVLGTFTMLALYLTEQVMPTLDRESLNAWSSATVASIVVRAALNWILFTPTPYEAAKSNWIRFVPLLVVALSAAQWAWSVYLFIGHDLTAHALILFCGFLGVSVAVTSLWYSTPAAVVLYLATAWCPFFLRLHQVSTFPTNVLVLLAIGVVLVLWSCVILQVKQIRAILDGSDERELFLARLGDANLELKAANAALQAANMRLDAMRSEAGAELESRSLFFSTASHDFRQRLHAMKLLAHGAIEQFSVAGKTLPRLKRLAGCVEEVECYITDVLDFARFDGNGLRPRKHVVPLQQIFQRLDVNFEETAADKGVRMVVRATAVTLVTDAAMLQRILENLVSNAIKFSSNKVLVAARGRAGALAIEVWDQGDGIAPELHGKIFAPFYQATPAPSVSNDHVGVGLGLAVVKRFADCLGYTVSVRSRAGRGTVMTVLIPAADIQIREHHEELTT